MSYQQLPPTTAMSMPGAPVAAAPGKRNTPLLIAGAVLLVAGIVAGLVLFTQAGAATEDSVRDLARAPVGCTTTLQFDETGTFLVFVETKGRLDDVGGDCAANGDEFEFDDDDVPRVVLTLTDEDDDEIDIDDDDGVSYDVGGFVGRQEGSVRIDAPGTFRLRVEADAEELAVAIGKDPTAAEGSLQTTALIVGVVGVAAGLVLLLLGMRRKPGTPVGPVAAAAPAHVPGMVPGWQPQPPPAAPQQWPPAPPAQQPWPPAPPAPPPWQPQPPQAPPPPQYGQAPAWSEPTQPVQPPGDGWGAPPPA